MKWMETIKVQSATGKEQTTESELNILAHEVQKNPARQGLWEATVSSHPQYPDISLCGYFGIPMIRKPAEVF